MIKIHEYPYRFELAGDTWELHQAMIRWERASGKEDKLSLDGEIVAVEVFDEVDDAVVVVHYPEINAHHAMGRLAGWRGPFKTVTDIVLQNGHAAVVDADGTHVL